MLIPADKQPPLSHPLSDTHLRFFIVEPTGASLCRGTGSATSRVEAGASAAKRKRSQAQGPPHRRSGECSGASVCSSKLACVCVCVCSSHPHPSTHPIPHHTHSFLSHPCTRSLTEPSTHTLLCRDLQAHEKELKEDRLRREREAKDAEERAILDRAKVR